ncbi:MAG TPA: molybdenum cofactor guanylyltransferase [Methanolinea sp.]|jgi:molybdopterin-guanine dinucleotide biosynthesis protein A|nr:MAG: molybdopterin-guanine dinucleotide biosynthesis protein MobA [Methanoregulaceae archaeon PtaB.Bin009]OPY40577.1 MAG: molybdopterin-guanine dinucleotide biosynthesis protein MobA [Methanoregulaceae archaeon PtaU1.Bin066]HII76228.1 molybdenum cofactor guanylyltransferase [Methanolinea sp.]HNQ29167.1 molybdenum cofactor guanylyltransferase [Methanolinea sp.]HNS82225.1 molybdenum cofactor guanylyltransferase [Methanolinea sp.]
MDRSAVILVGGEAKRANGLEKYFFTFGGKTFIERLTDTLAEVVDEIILVAKDPAQCSRFSHLDNVRCVTDIRRGYGPIGGLHAGALAAKGDALFVCACDMPCVSTQVVESLFSLLEGYDAVIPQWATDMIEPLHAVYRRSALLSALESHESLSLRRMVKGIRTRYVDVAGIRELDPELRTFININKIEDLGKLS